MATAWNSRCVAPPLKSHSGSFYVQPRSLTPVNTGLNSLIRTYHVSPRIIDIERPSLLPSLGRVRSAMCVRLCDAAVVGITLAGVSARIKRQQFRQFCSQEKTAIGEEVVHTLYKILDSACRNAAPALLSSLRSSFPVLTCGIYALYSVLLMRISIRRLFLGSIRSSRPSSSRSNATLRFSRHFGSPIGRTSPSNWPAKARNTAGCPATPIPADSAEGAYVH
jgi:hypothetical protein